MIKILNNVKNIPHVYGVETKIAKTIPKKWKKALEDWTFDPRSDTKDNHYRKAIEIFFRHTEATLNCIYDDKKKHLYVELDFDGIAIFRIPVWYLVRRKFTAFNMFLRATWNKENKKHITEVKEELVKALTIILNDLEEDKNK